MTLKRGARFLPASLLFLACKPPMHVTPVPDADMQVHQSGGAQAVKPGGPVMAGVGLGVATSDLTADKPAGQVMVGVGDIASCTQKLGLATAMLVDSIIKSDSVADVPTTTFTLGDNVYSSGSEAQFAKCFTPSWGNPKLEVMKNMHPTPGNHDYGRRKPLRTSSTSARPPASTARATTATTSGSGTSSRSTARSCPVQSSLMPTEARS